MKGFLRMSMIKNTFIGFTVAILALYGSKSLAAGQTVGNNICGEKTVKYPHDKWAHAKPEQVGLKPQKLEAIDEFLKSCGQGTSGLLLRHGKIAHTWGDIEKQYDVASCTKVFTSTAIGLAVADKKLSLDDKIYKFVPEVNSPKDKNITIAHLLSMTSEYGRPGMPGEAWAYTGAPELLPPVINAKYNMSMAHFMRIRVMEPIGAMNWQWPAYEKSDGKIFSIASGGLNISAGDMARFGYLFLNNGCWEGKRLIPKEWIALATRSSQELNAAYGYLWWVNTEGDWPCVPTDAYCALGQQARDILFVCPSLDLIAVRLGGDSLGDEVKLPDFLKLLVDSVQE
jgi:CubicO group peptidase (beta-lactamase class C family)